MGDFVSWVPHRRSVLQLPMQVGSRDLLRPISNNRAFITGVGGRSFARDDLSLSEYVNLRQHLVEHSLEVTSRYLICSRHVPAPTGTCLVHS